MMSAQGSDYYKQYKQLLWPGKMASTLPQTLNFSRFFNKKEFSNTVEIIVNETKFVCSGVVIAQQSPVFESIFMSSTSFVLLEDFFFPGAEIPIEECLMLMYGSTVLFTINNIETITRFAIIYEIKFMYDLCYEWMKLNISVQNVFNLFDIGNLPLVRLKRPDFMDVCLEFMKSKETEVGEEMSNRLKQDIVTKRDFIKAQLERSNCPSLIQFLIKWVSISQSNVEFVLELADLINFENLYMEHKELFIGLMNSMKSNMEDIKGLKHILELQLKALMI